MRRAVNIVGWAISVAYLCYVVWFVTSVPGPAPVPPSTEGVRIGLTEATPLHVFQEIARPQPEWRRRARRFPDAWSRFDDYSYHVGAHIHWLAERYGLHYSQVFLIYDTGVRSGWPGANGLPMTARPVPLAPRTR